MRSKQQANKANKRKATQNTKRSQKTVNRATKLTKKQKEQKTLDLVKHLTSTGATDQLYRLALEESKQKQTKGEPLKVSTLIDIIDNSLEQIINGHALVETVVTAIDEGLLEDDHGEIMELCDACDEITVKWMEDANAIIALSHTDLVPEDYIDMAFSFMANSMAINTDAYPDLIEKTEPYSTIINGVASRLIEEAREEDGDTTYAQSVRKIHMNRMIKVMPIYGTPAVTEEAETA